MTTFRVGEDISVGIIVEQGLISGVQSVQAFMAPSDTRGAFNHVPGNAPIVMQVTPRDATADVGPGWNFTLPAAQSAMLAPGTYGIDAVLNLTGGGKEMSEQTMLIQVTASAAR